eukprot:jgi/Ulvmu1/10194/UM006_0150.1
MSGNEGDLRRTSRVRKTPTKFAQDFDVLDGSPTPKAWDEASLRLFYDAVVLHGSANFRRVAQACNRPISMCEDMFNAHKPFLSAITQDNADTMWQYFNSFANIKSTAAAANEGGGTPVNQAAGGGRGRGGSRGRGTGRTPNHATTPTDHATSAGRQASKRTPRRMDMHDGGNDARAGPPTRKRRLDFTNISEGSPSLAFATAGDSPYTSKLDMLAAAASEAAGQAPTPVTSGASLDLRQSGPSSAAAGPPQQPSPTVDRENAPPTRTPRRAALAAAAAAARVREGSPDDLDAVNSPGCNVLAAAAAVAGARAKRAPSAGGMCHDFAIDLQNRAGDGFARNGKSYPEAAPDMLGRSHHPAGASKAPEGRTTSKGGSPRSPTRPEAVGVRATPPSTSGAKPLNAAIMRPPFQSLTAAAPPQRPPGSFRVSVRKSPPERLPLHLLQHRSWLMHGPGAPAGEPRPAGPDIDAELRLRRALSLRMRRWALYEFLTPMIDRGYLSDGSMAEYLANLGLDQIKSLSRADMSYIRTAVGAPPRRLSPAFLRQERGALHLHRERCRRAYEGRTAAEPHTGLPPGVPPQCTVGQQVVARHPVLRMLQDGAVLTVGASTYMVQFHRSELGVGKVQDTDLVPVEAMAWSPAQPLAEPESVPHDAAVDLAMRDFGAQKVQDQDLELMDDVSNLVQRKTQMMAELKGLLDQAMSDVHKLPDGSFKQDFQLRYTSKVAEFKQLNDELAVACSALKARVDQTASPDAMLTRTLSATAVSPAGGDEAMVAVASYIVEESMAEAAALVHDLFHEQRQKRIAEGAAAAAATAPSAAAAAVDTVAAAPAQGLPRPLPQAVDGAVAAAAPDQAAAGVSATKNGVVKTEAVLEVTTAAAAVPGGQSEGEAIAAVAGGAVPLCKVEASEVGGAADAEATLPAVGTGDAALGNLESPQNMALMMDDESLMHMSTKLTAMFIAIQRCAASGQDARTVQRALIKLVADLKPASQANTSQYQLITKNVGRLSVFLGAR